jgi:hypothetical protein
MKMATSKKQHTEKNQVLSSTPLKISKHGGMRPGAGRKPGSGNKPDLYEPCLAALAKALDGKPVFLFIAAMQALEAPFDDVREALGMSRDQFMREYGGFISACAELHQKGSLAFFEGRSAGTKA